MRRSLVLSIVAVALALGAAVPGAQQAPAPPFDVVIAGGGVVGSACAHFATKDSSGRTGSSPG